MALNGLIVCSTSLHREVLRQRFGEVERDQLSLDRGLDHLHIYAVVPHTYFSREFIFCLRHFGSRSVAIGTVYVKAYIFLFRYDRLDYFVKDSE